MYRTLLNLEVQDLIKNLTLQTDNELDSENELEVDQENNEANI